MIPLTDIPEGRGEVVRRADIYCVTLCDATIDVWRHGPTREGETEDRAGAWLRRYARPVTPSMRVRFGLDDPTQRDERALREMACQLVEIARARDEAPAELRGEAYTVGASGEGYRARLMLSGEQPDWLEVEGPSPGAALRELAQMVRFKLIHEQEMPAMLAQASANRRACAK